MTKHYEHASDLAREIKARRQARALSFEKLGVLAGVDVAQAFRICRGEFKTLNPSVLRICNVLGIQPEADGMVLPLRGDSAAEAMLSAEVLTAWDRTEAGAELLKRVLRALHPAR
jgi:transcriptional regulator with XRE-family HTH domain